MGRQIEIELDNKLYESAVAAYYEDGTLDDDEPTQAHSRAFVVKDGIRVELSNADYSQDHHHFAEVHMDEHGNVKEVVGIIYTLRSEDLDLIVEALDPSA